MLGAATSSDRGWQRQLHHWDVIRKKFGIEDTRYSEFRYLSYLDITDPYVCDYFDFHMKDKLPDFKNRLRNHVGFWDTLNTPEWIRKIIQHGIEIPFITMPPRIMLPNNRSVLLPEHTAWLSDTLREYLQLGFIENVDFVPHCVLPLQIKETLAKKSLIYDMSCLNEYVQKSKFKLESWEVMFYYVQQANYAIKFDLKKYYHQIDIAPEYYTYFGFMYKFEHDKEHKYYIWRTLP